MVAPTEQERASLPEMSYMARRPFSKPINFVKRREMAHPLLTKGFLQLSPKAAMLFDPSSASTHLPFLLMQNLCSKDIARIDITSWKLYDAYMHLSRIIG